MNPFFDTCGLIIVKLEGVNGIQPFVMEHTTKTCSENAVPLAWIVCGTIVIIALLVTMSLLAKKAMFYFHEKKVAEKNRNNQEEDRKNKQITEYQSREIEFIKEERLSINKIKNDQLEPTLKIIEEVFISINKTQTKINETIRKNEKQNEKDARNALKELNEKEKNFETEMKKVKESLDEIKNKLDEIITSDKMDYIKLLDTFINCNKNKVENEGTTEQA